ncbi:MAG: aldo/keto reductase [Lentisphaeria bacterium]
MHYRTLGQSGIEASVVALGTWAIGGWMWGGTDEKDSINAIHAAIDAGINFIDTAPIYGFGASERILGRAIKDRRDQLILATKCGMVCDPGVGEQKFRSSALGVDSHGLIDIHIYLGAKSIRDEVENSLKRLQTDYIDLLQTHWQEQTTPIEETMSTLMKLKDEGKIRAIGVCNASSQQMDEYRNFGTLDCDQEKFSMIDRQIEDDQLSFCRNHEMAVLAYSPLALGLLTGKMGPEREFAEGDLRHNNPRFSVDNRRVVADMLREFEPIAANHDLSLAQLTIAWTVAQPGLTHALVGARNPQQAQENATAGDMQLPAEEVEHMNRIIARYNSEIA